jgi:CheY-like chemotaxis protein
MHILLVEDSREDASLFTDFLAEEMNAPDVYWVASGKEALDYLAQRGKYATARRPDIILLDIFMPHFDGPETLRELKKIPQCSDMPVLILSGSNSLKDYNNCLGLGANGFIQKPYNLQGYEDLVRRLLNTEFPRLTQPETRLSRQEMH